MSALLNHLAEPKTCRRIMTMSDQGVSSVTNILVFILVARSFGSAAVGAFSATLIAYQLVLGGHRALVGQPLLSLYSHVPPSARRRLLGDLHGATLLVSVLSAILVAGTGTALGGVTGSALTALALVLPFLLLQDTWRFVFIVDRPAAALAVDVAWLLVVLAAFPLAPSGAEVSWFVLLWGAGAALGAALGGLLAGGFGGRPRPLRWLLGHRDMGSRFFGEFAIARGLNRAVTSSLGALAGLGALGAVQAGQIYYGPLNTLHGGLHLTFVPEGARLRDQPVKLRRLFAKVSVGLATVAAAWTAAGLLLPDRWGEKVFGATWLEASDLILPLGLAMVASSVMSGGLLGLGSLGDARRSLRAQIRSAPFEGACPLAGVVLGGAVGFATGFAVARALSAVIWWASLDASLRAGVEPPGEVAVEGLQGLGNPVAGAGSR